MNIKIVQINEKIVQNNLKKFFIIGPPPLIKLWKN